jgi:hypothetical protein
MTVWQFARRFAIKLAVARRPAKLADLADTH